METMAINNSAMAVVGQGGTDRLGELRRLLRAGREAEACAIVDAIAAHPSLFVQSFGFIRKAFDSTDRTSLLLDTLLQMEPHRLRHLVVIANIFALAARSDLRHSSNSVVTMLEKRGCLDQARFRTRDYLVTFESQGVEGLGVLARCKYGDHRSDLQFWQAVEHIRTALVVPETVLQNLYKVSRCKGANKEAWRNDVCTAFAIEHVSVDWHLLRKHAPRKGLLVEAATDRELAKQFFQNHRTSGGLLLLMFHSGFLTAATYMFGRYGGRYGVERTSLGVASPGREGPSPAGALFAAQKLLSRGGMVRVAPDGMRGTNLSTIEVLGGRFPVGNGAAFLAFENGCETGWYTAVRRGDALAPAFVRGPKRQAGEKFASFQDRILDFYARQISDHLTGDPRNLALAMGWLRLFENGGTGSTTASAPSLAGVL